MNRFLNGISIILLSAFVSTSAMAVDLSFEDVDVQQVASVPVETEVYPHWSELAYNGYSKIQPFAYDAYVLAAEGSKLAALASVYSPLAVYAGAKVYQAAIKASSSYAPALDGLAIIMTAFDMARAEIPVVDAVAKKVESYVASAKESVMSKVNSVVDQAKSAYNSFESDVKAALKSPVRTLIKTASSIYNFGKSLFNN